MSAIQMLDLRGLHQRLEPALSEAMKRVVDEGAFIRGADVGAFECDLAAYLNTRYTLGVGNGTDALQIALMALDLKPGDEVITSPFTFIATAEAAALLGLVPRHRSKNVQPGSRSRCCGDHPPYESDRPRALIRTAC